MEIFTPACSSDTTAAICGQIAGAGFAAGLLAGQRLREVTASPTLGRERDLLRRARGDDPAAAIAQPAQNRVLKMVPQANLTSLDPIWTTANITRNHGYMVFDTLYGMDAQFRPQPQMAAGHLVENGGLSVTITLRDGLRFHDGEPVRAIDCTRAAIAAMSSSCATGRREHSGGASAAIAGQERCSSPIGRRLVATEPSGL